MMTFHSNFPVIISSLLEARSEFNQSSLSFSRGLNCARWQCACLRRVLCSRLVWRNSGRSFRTIPIQMRFIYARVIRRIRSYQNQERDKTGRFASTKVRFVATPEDFSQYFHTNRERKNIYRDIIELRKVLGPINRGEGLGEAGWRKDVD